MEQFLAQHKVQLEVSGIPERYWETLFTKIKLETFDAGDWFMMQLVEECYSDCEDDLAVGDEAQDMDEEEEQGSGFSDEEQGSGVTSWRVVVSYPQGIDHLDPQHVYLIDHAWTYRLEHARSKLESNSTLLSRMAKLMKVDEAPERSTDEIVEDVLTEMWKYNQTYNIAAAQLGTEAALPLWYVMDEFGSRIQHSDNFTVMMVPFCYGPTQTTFTVMWPVRTLMEGDELTRDYLNGRAGSDPLLKKLLLLPWQPEDMRHLSYDVKEDTEMFFMKFAQLETMPNLETALAGETPPTEEHKLKIFTDMDQVMAGLTDTRFEFVDSPADADIIWTQHHLQDFKAFSEETPDKYINQFPCECMLTVKHLLAVVARRASSLAGGGFVDHRTLATEPPWLPATFNLKTELSQFVSYFQHRAARGLDNHWICKPFNLARGLDAKVTNDLNCILRLAESGPKIACKYVTNPVLLSRDDIGPVKFDLRFVVMVISVAPLKLVVHQKFIVRVANKPFSLDQLDDYEKHFTVMNYKKGVNMKKISCEEFVDMFDSQLLHHKWNNVLDKIHAVIRELFTAAVIRPPPAGIGHSPQSRAIYGVDVMLEWGNTAMDEKGVIQPVLLECNFGPDNTRLLSAYPDFYNDLFSSLFFFDVEGRTLTPL